MSAAPLSAPTHIIASESEAIEIAKSLAPKLRGSASSRDLGQESAESALELISRSGLLAVTVPRAFGGVDASFETVTQIFKIIAAADPAIAQLPQNHFVFVDAIRQDGTDAQQRYFFGEVLAGARFGNAQAERGGGSALDLKTRLLSTGNGEYRLSGTKYYCTGAKYADWLPVAALDDRAQLVLAYVRRQASGVQILDDWNAMGQRATASGTVVFYNVLVPWEHVVPHWRLFDRPSLFHAYAAQLHAAIDVGIAENALGEAAACVRSRTRPRLGAEVARAVDDPLLLLRFGQLSTKLHAAEELVLRAARQLDAAMRSLTSFSAACAAVAVGEAKAFSEDVVMEITNDIFALIGSSATDDGLNLHRHWRNARTHTVHDANQWRYHCAGNYFLNGVAPGKPRRQLDKGDRSDGGTESEMPLLRVAT